jgi:hypothetical protein
MFCGNSDEMDHCGGGGDIQPPDGLAMAPLQNYHSEKIGIVHCLISFPLAARGCRVPSERATLESCVELGRAEECFRCDGAEIST